MIYFDTSALTKLVFDEAESMALTHWSVDKTDVPKVSSDLSTTELLRTCGRVDEGAVESANLLLGEIDLLPMGRTIVERAAHLVPTDLRSLDAIHLASALSIKTHLIALVAYGSRLCSAAVEAGVAVVSPS